MSEDRLATLVEIQESLKTSFDAVTTIIQHQPSAENISLMEEVMDQAAETRKLIARELMLRAVRGEDTDSLREKYNL